MRNLSEIFAISLFVKEHEVLSFTDFNPGDVRDTYQKNENSAVSAKRPRDRNSEWSGKKAFDAVSFSQTFLSTRYLADGGL